MEHWCENSTGCRQGDQLSPSCFCVVFQLILEAIQELVEKWNQREQLLNEIIGGF